MDKIEDIISDIRAGKMVILVDDEDRENEGDLIIASDYVNSDVINFMAKEARGLICLALTGEQISKLGLPLMVKDEFNFSQNKTAFTVSIEAAEGVSTGISAQDRAHTIRVASNPNSVSKDIIVPGHVFPIRAQEGGVLKRAGHTEASVDLAKLAGLNPAAVICEIMNPDGSMARVRNLKEFAQNHKLKIGTIEDLIKYRLETESHVSEIAKAQLESEYGKGFDFRVYKSSLDGKEHVALTKGNIRPDVPVLVRVQSENVLGDVFAEKLTQSNHYIQQSMKMIEEAGAGVIVYLRTESMQGGLGDRVESFQKLEDVNSYDEAIKKIFKTDYKDYGVGAQILRSLGVHKMKVITNNPSKRVGMKGYGLDWVESVPLNLADISPSIPQSILEKSKSSEDLI